ncbi:MAG: sulfotransferase domain-containing protein [Acidobacteria bacterium]|nr:sulfotransferase domain-containing protein [Acidobacteriota bacterium]
MVLPNFIVVGAPRCATTTLHYYLARHQQVRMSAIKEPNFFLFGRGGEPSIAEPSIIRKSVKGQEAYEQLFGEPSSEERAIGEASPLYLYVREAAERILAVCGAIKIVCLVRDPVERAWSHFLYALPDQAGDDAEAQFRELCEAEIRAGPGYEPYRTETHLLRLGRYGEQVRRYQRLFGTENVEVLVLEQLEREPGRTGDELCAFLGIDPAPLTVADRLNISGKRTGGLAGPVGRVVRRLQPTIKGALPPRIAGRLALLRAKVDDRSLHPVAFTDTAYRARLQSWFRDDIDDLAAATGANLSHWLS